MSGVDLLDIKRARLAAREARRLRAAGGADGRLPVVHPMVRSRQVPASLSQPMPEQWTIGGKVAGDAHLLVMSVNGATIASGGDYVAFDTIDAQHQFVTVATAAESWVHPVSGVYVLAYRHAWGDYSGGGTVELELDGSTSAASEIVGDGSGSVALGFLEYYASAGQVGRVKVSHLSGVAQSCSATVSVAISDPTGSVNTGDDFAGVRLYVDGVVVASQSGEVTDDFSDATVLVGHVGSGLASGAFYYDDVQVVQGANLLGNPGFESALAGTGTGEVFGNWNATESGSGSASIVASPVHAGAGAVECFGTGSSLGYVMQDVTIASSTAWGLQCYVRRPVSGEQIIEIAFGWDRGSRGAARSVARMNVSPTATTFNAFSLSGSAPAITSGQWVHVELEVTV